PLGTGIWQRVEQHRIDHAENGNVCANAQRQREKRYAGVPMILAEHPDRHPEVLCQYATPLGSAAAFAQAVCIIRSMAPSILSKSATSRSNCLRPPAVSL